MTDSGKLVGGAACAWKELHKNDISIVGHYCIDTGFFRAGERKPIFRMGFEGSKRYSLINSIIMLSAIVIAINCYLIFAKKRLGRQIKIRQKLKEKSRMG